MLIRVIPSVDPSLRRYVNKLEVEAPWDLSAMVAGLCGCFTAIVDISRETRGTAISIPMVAVSMNHAARAALLVRCRWNCRTDCIVGRYYSAARSDDFVELEIQKGRRGAFLFFTIPYARLGSNQRLSAPEADTLSAELRAPILSAREVDWYLRLTFNYSIGPAV